MGCRRYYRYVFWLLVGLLAGAEPLQSQQAITPASYRPAREIHQSADTAFVWHDSARNRDIPIRLYYPARGEGQFPAIIFSHGLGGSRDDYAYLGRRWAKRGYIVIHPEHEGSDKDVWKNSDSPRTALRDAANNWENGINRPLDVKFILDQLERMTDSTAAFYGRIAVDRIGVAGHSFGAHTTMVLTGYGAFYNRADLHDARVDAAVVMSATIGEPTFKLKETLRSVRVPTLHMTTANDRSPVSGTMPQDRRLPFELAELADQYFLLLNRGPHMLFAGPDAQYGAGPTFRDEYELILQTTTAFWDVYLRDDSAARQWLTGGKLDSLISGKATFESRPANK